MKAIIISIALIAVAAALPAPLLYADSEHAIAGDYIVVFKTDVSAKAQNVHVRRVQGLAKGVDIPQSSRFSIGDFAGYNAQLSNSTLSAVLNMPEVSYVEVNQVVSVSQTCAQQTNSPSWGLQRVSEVALNLNGNYQYITGAGTGVTAYIIDTGIYIGHQDFAGRAVWGSNFVDTQNDDCNGHGTHVAGTVGGTLYGIAKKVTLVAVKVLNCAGSGTNAGVISGIQYVATEHQKKADKAVVNMSLGGGKSTAVNAAVAAAVAAGVSFAVAAGNSNADACLFSPASEPTAISVGSTAVAQSGAAEIDTRSSFSNFGTCTQIYAPGSLITSAWIGSVNAVNTISGTSMASPHVAGVAALILSQNPTYTPAQVKAAIVATATSNQITFNCGSSAACNASPNRLLHKGCF